MFIELCRRISLNSEPFAPMRSNSRSLCPRFGFSCIRLENPCSRGFDSRISASISASVRMMLNVHDLVFFSALLVIFTAGQLVRSTTWKPKTQNIRACLGLHLSNPLGTPDAIASLIVDLKLLGVASNSAAELEEARNFSRKLALFLCSASSSTPRRGASRKGRRSA
jgi:hypothetical protein